MVSAGNNEGGYSMNPNPGEDQWGQFNLDNQPGEGSDDAAVNKENSQEKSLERGAKSVEVAVKELTDKLAGLEESYKELKDAGRIDEAKAIAEQYQKTFQKLTFVKEGVGSDPDEKENEHEVKMRELGKEFKELKDAGHDDEAKAIADQYQEEYQQLVASKETIIRNNPEKTAAIEELIEKGKNNKGFINFKSVKVMTVVGFLAAGFLVACAKDAKLTAPKEKDPVKPVEEENENEKDLSVDLDNTFAGEEENKDAYTGYKELDEELKGNVFHGETCKGCWDDQESKAVVKQETGRIVDNDFMTTKVLYEQICADPANPTDEEIRAVSKYGALAMAEEAVLTLRDGMGLPEFQNMSNEEAVAYLKGLSEDSEEYKNYVDKICHYYDTAKLTRSTVAEFKDSLLAQYPEEVRAQVQEWLTKHQYVNGATRKIEAMNLPTSDEAKVFIWTYTDEETGTTYVRIKLKDCNNDFDICFRNNEYRTGSEDTPSGWEPSGEEPTGDEPSGDEPTANEPSGDEPTANEPSGDEPTANEPSGDEPTANEPSGDEPTANEPSGDEPTGAEPTGTEPSGDEPTGGSENTPKDPNAPNDPNRKGDGDPQELDVDVTPPTTGEDDKKPIEDLKKHEEEEKKKKEEEEKRKKEQEEAEKKAKEEAEKRRQEEEERKKKEEEEKKADEAKKKAEEEAKKEQEKRAEEERRKEEEEKRRKEQEEADKREEENRKKAEDDSNKNADDRKNDWENGDF